MGWILLWHSVLIPKIKNYRAAWFLIATAAFTGILWTPIRDMAHREGAAKTEGILIPPRGEKDDKRVLIRIGDSNAIIENQMENPEHAPVFATDDSYVFVWRRSGLYHISATIRDEDGKMVLQINDNHWSIGNYPVWDKNYNDNALEVKDAKGRVVFQIILLPDTVRFQARILNGYGQECEYRSEGNGLGAEIDISPNSNKPINKPIKPLFKYPSRDNWGLLSAPIGPVYLSKIYPTAVGFNCVSASMVK
jgi:hypothetical protein